MQLAIELPGELGQEVLQHANVQQVVKRSLEKEINQTEQELFSLMAKIPSSVSLVDELIRERKEERKEEAKKECKESA